MGSIVATSLLPRSSVRSHRQCKEGVLRLEVWLDDSKVIQSIVHAAGLLAGALRPSTTRHAAVLEYSAHLQRSAIGYTASLSALDSIQLLSCAVALALMLVPLLPERLIAGG